MTYHKLNPQNSKLDLCQYGVKDGMTGSMERSSRSIDALLQLWS